MFSFEETALIGFLEIDKRRQIYHRWKTINESLHFGEKKNMAKKHSSCLRSSKATNDVKCLEKSIFFVFEPMPNQKSLLRIPNFFSLLCNIHSKLLGQIVVLKMI